MIKKHMPKYTLEELYEGSEEVVFDKDFRITRVNNIISIIFQLNLLNF